MGLAALLKDETYVVTKTVFCSHEPHLLGLVAVLVGGLLILVALGLFSGNEVSRRFRHRRGVRQPDQPVRVGSAQPLWSLT